MDKKRAVVAIVNYRGKILVGKKRLDSHKFLRGEWHIPGGAVEGNETDEIALIREIREEAGIEVKVGKYIASHLIPSSKKEARWYECFSLTNKITSGDDLEKVKWVLRRDVLNVCSERAYSLWPKKIIDYFS